MIEPVERDRSADAWHRPVVKEQPGLHSDRVCTDEDAPDDDGRTSLPRSGRLVAADEGVRSDDDADLFASDVGIDGGAASAEVAAVHITDEPDDRLR